MIAIGSTENHRAERVRSDVKMVETNGLKPVLFEPADAKVDIVFVHGLGGDRTSTWTSAPTRDIPKEVFWPKDLLPQVCTTARILSFGYDASFAHFYPFYGPKNVPVGTTLDDHSTALFQSLIGLRNETETSDRPIIFVAHSLGGLVCANALSRQHGPDQASCALVKQTRAMIFLGTPFEGSEKAEWANTALRYLSWISSTNNEKTKDLEERSAKLASINEAFLKFLKARDRSKIPVEVACYFEEYPIYVAGKKLGVIVPRKSAVLAGIDPLSIPANHVDMCKFEDEDRNGFRSISEKLSQWITVMDANLDEDSGQSVRMGDTIYHGNIDKNSGVVMGNAYTPAKDGIKITGSTSTYYYGHSGNALDSTGG